MHFCPAICVNKHFLLSSQSCLKAFENRTEDISENLLISPFIKDKNEAFKLKEIIHHHSEETDLSIIETKMQMKTPVCLPSVSVRIVYPTFIVAY